jgi:hypothetical protein
VLAIDDDVSVIEDLDGGIDGHERLLVVIAAFRIDGRGDGNERGDHW